MSESSSILNEKRAELGLLSAKSILCTRSAQQVGRRTEVERKPKGSTIRSAMTTREGQVGTWRGQSIKEQRKVVPGGTRKPAKKGPGKGWVAVEDSNWEDGKKSLPRKKTKRQSAKWKHQRGGAFGARRPERKARNALGGGKKIAQVVGGNQYR